MDLGCQFCLATPPNYGLFFVGLVFIFFGFFKPYLLYYPYKLWMRIGDILGWINSRIILTIIYILVLIPISLIMRLFDYDPLKIRRIKAISYKEKINKKSIDLTKVF